MISGLKILVDLERDIGHKDVSRPKYVSRQTVDMP